MKHLISLSLILTIIFSASPLISQYGVRLKYNQSNYDDWTNGLKTRYPHDQEMFRSGYEVGVDYWFRLKKYRLEFLPEIMAGYSVTNYDESQVKNTTLQRFGLNFHSQIYALDLEGDCNCPTFSKEGPSINKGFFLHLTPGIEMHKADITMDPISSFAFTPSKTTQILGKIGIGLGLDLGLSDLFTLTPMISYYYFSNAKWDNFALASNPVGFVPIIAEGTPTQLQFTMRLGIRSDYGKKGRRR
jgi:hypothetical protein